VSQPILESLSPKFSREIRVRGRDYYRRGAVRLAETGPERVLAFVQGTRRYTVELLIAGDRSTLSCTCPYFLDREQPCKHQWAVLLTLNRSGYFSRQHGSGAPTQAPAPTTSAALPEPATPPSVPEWKLRLEEIRSYQRAVQGNRRESWPAGREFLYVFDIPRTFSDGAAIVDLWYREPGLAGVPIAQGGGTMRLADLWQIPDPRDREILAVLRGVSFAVHSFGDFYRSYPQGRTTQLLYPSYCLDVDLVRFLLPKMGETGRLFLRTRGGERFEPEPVILDEPQSWEFRLKLEASDDGQRVLLEGCLRREDQVMSLSEPAILLLGELMFARGRLSRYRLTGSFAWISMFRQNRQLAVSRQELSALLQDLLSFPQLYPLELADSLAVRTVEPEPRPRLTVRKTDPGQPHPTGGRLSATLSFEYEGRTIDHFPLAAGIFVEPEGLLVRRRPAEEKAAFERLLELGFRRRSGAPGSPAQLRLAARRLPAVVERLLAEDWQVEAEGRLLRTAGRFDMRVVSGIDWFELRGSLRFGNQEASLPDLLRALRKGANMVRLGDGSFGMLPERWLQEQGFLLRLAEAQADHLRFKGSQAYLIELFLQTQPQATCDEAFQRLRERLQGFTSIRPLGPPPGFAGELRGYQQEGLGWFRFLDVFAFGGCLADDMGLGKTVQALALLQRLRVSNESPQAPSLVVVPKSLVFNWRREAARFTPDLKVLDYTGTGRLKDTLSFGSWDVVLTTYGTMRNDIALLKDFTFSYIILDEAQLIKNPSSSTAKAARLLRGRRRLALSGTPIENHLGELWSLFEFLNPGMLGGVPFFRKCLQGTEGLGEGVRGLLARYLRPFILRRTKDQVAPELPARVEQTVFCRLDPGERRLYDELREHYRSSIMNVGLDKSKIQVLEALLRLRQAACHPGLLDRSLAGRSSAKIDLLLQHLEDVLAEEHKALVFSQFTSLLAIVRDRLDRQGIVYEYLDGRTRDRASRVDRFQRDTECRLFLISLKAGGLGLNLTAAEYVFLLDPWWNPASEAQAIDRTHRIGQDKKVFAYRLIAKDTVEEKVLELQQAKRELAEAIIQGDNRLIGELAREDLELLLS
jgi:superfamily II DNA or RNA helicase